MSYNQQPKIITEGLVLSVDAGDIKSYLGSGTTWTDRIGAVAGTIDGASFSRSNGGVFDFDGTNDYVSFGNPSDTQFIYSDTFSLEAWVNPDSLSGFTHIIGKTYGNYRLAVISSGYSFRLDSNELTTTSGSPAVGEWQNVVATWEPSSSTARVYVNGVLEQSKTDTDVNWTSTSSNFQIGNSPGESYYFNGKIPIGRAYNTTLSEDQVKQNYNALKGRFT
jgi:hypothetical protein